VSRFRLLSILLLASAFGMAIPASAATACAHVLVGVNRTSVSRGQTLTISAAAKNCSAAWESLTVAFTLTYTAPDGSTHTSQVLTTTVGVGAQNLHTATYTYTVPTNAPLGRYVLRAKAYVSGQWLAMDSAGVTVK
jgi:hypothetical protein